MLHVWNIYIQACVILVVNVDKYFSTMASLPPLPRQLQIAVGTAGPEPRVPDRSGHCQTLTISCGLCGLYFAFLFLIFPAYFR